jgi:nitrate reductase gamma subunit
MTAYLTGLRTNSFLFDMGIMSRFAIMSFLPDVCLTILSFTLRTNPVFSAGSIILVLAILIGTTAILYRGIENKWSRTGFDV